MKRGFFPRCDGIWCGKCYEADREGEAFPVRLPIDEEGNLMEIKKSDIGRFMYGQPGDHWMTTFQCEVCHFRNVQGRDPCNMTADGNVIRCIHRASLDAFWSREPSTVAKNVGQLKLLDRKAREAGINCERLFPTMGPLPLQDKAGMGVAICVLMRTLDQGVNEETIQFGTASSAKTAFANMWRASTEGAGLETVMARDRTKMFQMSCPTSGDWFERFTLGMHKRMGDKVKLDEAISMGTMLELMRIFEWDFENVRNGNIEEQAEVLFPALFIVLGYCAALRGEEVPMMDLKGAKTLFETGMNHPNPMLQHVVIPLTGRFKNETGEMYHIIPVVLETASGLKPGVWMARMLDWFGKQGVTDGWVFRDNVGRQIRATDYDYEFCRRLAEIQMTKVELIRAEVDVFDAYSLCRSLRRGSDSQAIAQQVAPDDIDLNNRWRRVEQAGSRKATFQKMRQHYADVRILLPALLRYSRAL